MKFHSYCDKNNNIIHVINDTPINELELFCIGLCHTVEVRIVGGVLEYQGTSPDEIAFV